MKTQHKIIVTLSLFFICLLGEKLCSQDSINFNRNHLFVEVLGNNYSSPFVSYKLISSPFSINYSRTIQFENSCWQLCIGTSLFRGWWVEDSGHSFIYHRPLELSVPCGFLIRKKYKRNGLWAGLFFTSAFGKQSYSVVTGQNSVRHTLKFDYQIMPELSYQFHSINDNALINVFLSPKISLNSIGETGYLPIFYPLWGGISIGGGW